MHRFEVWHKICVHSLWRLMVLWAKRTLPISFGLLENNWLSILKITSNSMFWRFILCIWQLKWQDLGRDRNRKGSCIHGFTPDVVPLDKAVPSRSQGIIIAFWSPTWVGAQALGAFWLLLQACRQCTYLCKCRCFLEVTASDSFGHIPSNEIVAWDGCHF